MISEPLAQAVNEPVSHRLDGAISAGTTAAIVFFLIKSAFPRLTGVRFYAVAGLLSPSSRHSMGHVLRRHRRGGWVQSSSGLCPMASSCSGIALRLVKSCRCGPEASGSHANQ